MALLESLNKKRGIQKAKLTNFKTYLNKLATNNADKDLALSESDKLELMERLEKIDLVLKGFESIQDELDLLETDGEEIDPYRSEFEDIYFSLVATAKQFLSRGSSKNESTKQFDSTASEQLLQQVKQLMQPSDKNVAPGSSQPVVIKSSGLQLPQIELPKFNGELSDWLGFRDTFESLIHKNIEISPIEKFHYLVAALRGGASQVIESLEFSAANYAIAWEALCSRYNNKRLLIQNHIKTIVDCEPMTKESSVQIRKLLDNINKHLRALSLLGQSTENWDSLLIYLLSAKLDSKTIRSWETEKTGSDIPTLKDFKKFLEARASLLETLEVGNSRVCRDSKPRTDNRFNSQNKKSFLAHKISCALCKEEHHIQTCPNFLSLSAYQRSEKVKFCRLCLNCLRPGHIQRDCKAKGCKQCQSKHNTLLHFGSDNSETSAPSTPKEKILFSATAISQDSDDGILSTAIVFARGTGTRQRSARVLLDTGSQCNLITAELCEALQLKKVPISVNIGSISDSPLQIKYKCELEIASQVSPFKMRVSCLVVPKIRPEIPNLPADAQSLGVPSHIKLADEHFNRTGSIDIFIGNSIFWSLICIGQVQLNGSGLLLQKTKLGWIFAGPNPGSTTGKVSCNFINLTNIEKQLGKFWELEECSAGIQSLSVEERACEDSFVNTTKRDKDGRFVVSIPFREDLQKLGNSRCAAERRLLGLERRLKKQSNLKGEYCSFMEEYLQLGHMSKVSMGVEPNVSYYLPHHCVVRPEKVSSKIRVVFDASAKTDSGVSLNDLQRVGPTLQSDLFSILIKFRKHKFVITADIEKMYRQVLIVPEQRALQRILWRFDFEKPIDVYELNTVTYGTAAASFLSIRCLFSIAAEYEVSNPKLAKIIREDFYVDDLLSGADTVEEAVLLAKQLSKALAGGCFNLRKWNSNSQQIVEKIVGGKKVENHIDLSKTEQVKTLGLVWETDSDELRYAICLSKISKVTKRQILAEISQIFDPLGLLGPCIIVAKTMLQQLWSEGLSWDESLPYNLHSQWQNYKNQLASLNNLRIPRLAVCPGVMNVQLHGFSDASKVAYGGCIYIRSQDNQGHVTIRLLASKSRVAPLKSQTIPRLELCGALLVSKLCKKVKLSLGIDEVECYWWTDSTIVLGWLRGQPNGLPVFVSNRVTQVQEITEVDHWKYVPTKLNPADCLSRGIDPDQLIGLSLWWSGPDFLQDCSSSWPSMPGKAQNSAHISSVYHVQKKKVPNDESIFSRFGSLSRLVRVVAYCRRFVQCCRSKNNKMIGALTVSELSDALIRLARLSQRVSFESEIRALTRDEGIVKGKLRGLNSFLDSDGTMRVGGRIRHSNLVGSAKHPIIINANHEFTRLLFRQKHVELLHAPPNLLLSTVREKFWPIGGRNLSRSIVHGCIRCSRFNPKMPSPTMGDLPASRVSPSFPFCNTGVDYAGPFLIKDRKGRGCKVTKCYLCLFICFSTKALHLELVSDATTDAFVAALRRFVSRRGKPDHIHSDNGRNFVGGNNELERLGQLLIRESNSLSTGIADLEIKWHFIPAYSPHFGGIWRPE